MKTQLFLPLVLLATLARAQAYHDKFQILTRQHDTTGIKKLLSEWEKVNPKDPELYTSAINFYFENSRRMEVSLEKSKAGKISLEFTDSAGKVAGYMNEGSGYRPDQVAIGIRYIDRGINKFPARLDMRFGKCYVLEEIADYGKLAAELNRTVEFSKSIGCNWLWTDNKKLDDGEQFMLKTIFHYLKDIYDTENDSLLVYIKQVGAATIRYYPNNVEILSTTAVANMLTNNYDIAIEYLLKAEKIKPTDFIVLNNLAQGYKQKGDKANAIKYYELTFKYGDEEAKEAAQKNLKELKE